MKTHKTPAPKLAFNSRHLLFLAFSALSIFSFFFLAGCTDPNSNLTYTSCCWQRAEPYECSITFDAEGKPITDSDGNFLLSGECGANCAKLSKDMQIAFDSSGAESDISLCANNCNFRRADCSNSKEDNTCYIMDGGGTTEKSLGPICANATANPCVQSQCSAMFCGEPVPKPQSGIDAESSLEGPKGEENSYKKAAQDVAGGLVEKICKIEPINRQNARLLSSDSWFVNSLRMGIQGSFSDYDRARYFLPPSDFYGGTGNLNSVVDKFTNYLDVDGKGKAGPLEIFKTSSEGFKAPLTTCEPEFAPHTASIVSYNCTTDDSRFPISTYQTPESARLACMKNCYFSQTRTCDENINLFTTSMRVSPRPAASIAWPFTDIYKYGQELAKAYPTPAPDEDLAPEKDPRNYYKELLPIPQKENYGSDAEYNAAMLQYSTESAKPGPAGAKVFECIENSDCMGGTCDTSQYSRGSCYLNDGTSVDCGCHYVTNCELEYPCQIYEAETTLRATCEANKQICKEYFGLGGGGEQSGEPMVVCDYKYTQTGAFVGEYYIPYTDSTDDAAAGCWDDTGCYGTTQINNGFIGIKQFKDFSCVMGGSKTEDGGKHQPDIEMGAIKRYMKNTPICIKNDGSGEVAPPFCSGSGKPEANCYEYSSFEYAERGNYWVAFTCGSSDEVPGWIGGIRIASGKNRDNYQCPPGYTLELNGEGWKDDDNSYANDPVHIYSNWGDAMEPVPTKQAVGNPGGHDTFIRTSENMEWCDSAADGYLSLSGLKGNCGYDKNTGEYKCSCSEDKFSWGSTKFKVIQACNLKLRQPGQTEDDDWDVELVQPNFYNGTEYPPARKLQGWGAYGSETKNPDILQGKVNSGYIFVGKTWRIRSMGDCQTDEKDRLTIVNYGICKPSGTVLSLAYQNISSYPPSLKSYCPIGCTQRSLAFMDTAYCQCPGSSAKTIVGEVTGGYITNPDYGFLTGKIEEFQQAGILPLLDMREYTFVVPQKQEEFCIDPWDKCESFGAIQAPDNEDCMGGWVPGRKCTISSSPDRFLEYLAGRHSAVILEVSNLPSDCPESAACANAAGSTENAAAACPDCILALEYPKLIDASQIQGENYHYPQELSEAISKYTSYPDGTKETEFDIERAQAPFEWIPDKPAHISNVGALVLNIDLSNLETTDKALLGAQLDATANMSRRVLQHVGWPTIWKLNYKRADGAGSFEQSILYDEIYARERELSLSGVLAILLPPLDNADPSGSTYANEEFGRLLHPAGTTVKDEDSAFCAAQEGSKEFLHPSIMAGVRRIYAKDSCACVSCSPYEITAGVCTSEASACLDGQACTKNAQSGDNFKCETDCIYSTCPLCDDSKLFTTCTAIQTTNKPPVECCKSLGDNPPDTYSPADCMPWPDCGKWTDIPVVELSNISLHPDSAYLISGLPKEDMCCVQNISYDADGNQIIAKYTYLQSSSLSMQSEPLVFPSFGSNETDCGRQAAVGLGESAVCGMPVPPIVDTIWSCATPYTKP
ncbi:hypothetical protein COU37_04380 [Candidatus Micrarchaeota archaeon CG10_big_fil_rev_8_21_14_0_10_45_29]|nr:MAG: hypothetical protein COU37_04380 [Candidatus Micrarchaeota archaeon CG10_big_fil_rev_8_21_14_0_10_45_29]